VFAVGFRDKNVTSPYRFAAFAFDASTGARLWGTASTTGQADSAVVSGDGGRLYVTGSTSGTNITAVTVAYDTTTGAVVWTRQDSGPGGHGFAPGGISVDPAGDHIVVSGAFGSVGGDFVGFAAVAYGSDGTKLWSARVRARQTGGYGGAAMSPDGTLSRDSGSIRDGRDRV
jgi:hypothetical protein